ncbi:PRD domain-containing protein [Corynebacterium pseudotuberculosis]|uniref:PRD domain-containing protein n=1 Tax=Corynebacterium pseudotuberculosis TaxID=1719 RepID=UPI000245A3DB|nr:PRD domain-containing protein [Corynebacterium pseudotuberculosis]AEX38602.1 PtsGHI operon antiterminator [Corynebacterium pseudotuberculosis 3/99-5]MEA1026072.1 PRD domain-containing protein [Corynebacterium pseudotuberculosis]
MPELIIRRVLSNNAVLAAENCSEAGERILVGKGIGFSKKPGDYVEHGGGSREYVELSEQHRALLEGLSSIDGATFHVISASIDVASDVLGKLHPSVYLILAEHLSFAVQRVGRGETIRNSLVVEIKAVVPEEFSAAELVVNYLNTHLDSIVLPIDEAAFIAFHLHAARTGGTVKQPLAVANAIGQVTAKAHRLLRTPAEAGNDALSMELALAYQRLQRKQLRHNVLLASVEKLLPHEYAVAAELLTDLSGEPQLPLSARGEAAFLAVFLHGWTQENVNKEKG